MGGGLAGGGLGGDLGHLVNPDPASTPRTAIPRLLKRCARGAHGLFSTYVYVSDTRADVLIVLSNFCL